MKSYLCVLFQLLSVSVCMADSTPPVAPTGLVAYKLIQSIWLEWAENEESDLAGYNVYRSETSGGGYDLLDSDIGDNYYEDDSAVSGTTYYYVVTAVDTSSNESTYSSEISARPFATRGGAGMLALGECDCPGLYISGTRDANILTILNGGIHINSYNFDEAFAVGYKATKIDTEYIHAVGGVDDRYEPPTELATHTNLGSEAVLPDPYEYLPEPIFDPSNDLGTISASGTYSPGYYSGGIQSGISNIILEPGNYYLDSVGHHACLEMTGGTLTGAGVTLYIIGNGDEGVVIRGNTNVDISAPTSGMYEGIAIFQSRDPDGDGDALNNPESEIAANTIYIYGAIYMPYNRLELGGTGEIFMTHAVADRFYIHGTGEIVIDYHGDRSFLGDFVDGGPVDLDDLLYFAQWWLTDYDVLADLNYDHRVDLADFAIVAENWTFF